MRKLFATACILLGLALTTVYAVYQQTPIPKCQGEECQGDNNGANHPDQPQWCQNTDNPDHAHNCNCIDMKDDKCDKTAHQGSKCTTFCRKKACKCATKCDMRTM